MRFLELHLSAFGPFTETSLDLSGGQGGLHVVYGPNEAGKSAALRAIRAVLFGIEDRTSDNFVHENKKLLVGARLRNSAGEQLALCRRKGRKGTLLNPDHVQGAAYPDDALDPFLRGVDAETFRRVYGIDHEELRRGGDELRKLQGLAGESLFAASLGGAALAELLAALESEAAELFGKRNSAIKANRKVYDEALKAKRAAEIPSSKWRASQEELARQRARRDENAEQLKAWRVRQNRLTRIRNTLYATAERKRLLDELDQAADVMVLPESYSAERRAKCQVQYEQAVHQIDRLQRECDDLQTNIDAIHVSPGLIENEKTISALDRRAGVVEKAATDRVEVVQPERDEAYGRARSLLRDLGLDVAWGDVGRFRLLPEQHKEIHALASEAKRVNSLPGELAAKRAELENDRRSLQDELDQLEAPRDVSELERSVDRVKRHGDLEAQEETILAKLASREAELQRELANLVLFDGSLEELVGLSIPLDETVDRFDREQTELAHTVDRLRHEVDTAENELAEVREAVAALMRTADPPTEEDLRRRRAHRDEGWRLVRRAWLDGEDDEQSVRAYAGEIPLEEAYERSVVEADRVADRLRHEADCVAQLAERHAREKRLATRLTESKRALEAAERRRDAHAVQWQRQWAAAGIPEPLPPREMRHWLAQRAKLTESAHQAEALRRDAERVNRHSTECRRDLAEHLAGVGEPVEANETLLSQLARAESALQRQQQGQRRRQQLEGDLRRAQRDLDHLAEKQRLAAEELDAWNQRWIPAMQLLGCPEDATAERAVERLRRFEELFKYADETDGFDARLRAMDNDARWFEEDVAEILGRVAPELAGLPSIQTAAELRRLLERAQHNRDRLNHLQADLEKRRQELDEAKAAHAVLGQQLEQLCRIAGVASHESLAKVEHESDEVTRRRKRLADIEQQLLEHGDGRSVDELVADAQGQDADDLAAQDKALSDEIAALEQTRDEIVGLVRDLEIQCAAADGSTTAAEADQRALGILAHMQTQAQRYLRVRLAAALLRRHIDQHRAENQDPLLDRAGELFARLTCAEFADIHIEYDKDDRAVLVGRRRAGAELVHVEAMSDGTGDQLYLALRLAYLERRLVQHEPMPVVLDDVLVNFDDDRALATLEVLGELAARTQILFFTHHRHLVELAEAAVPADALFVHQFDGRFSGSGARRGSRASSRPVPAG